MRYTLHAHLALHCERMLDEVARSRARPPACVRACDAAALLASRVLTHRLETAPLEIFLVHSKRIGPTVGLLRDLLPADSPDVLNA